MLNVYVLRTKLLCPRKTSWAVFDVSGKKFRFGNQHSTTYYVTYDSLITSIHKISPCLFMSAGLSQKVKLFAEPEAQIERQLSPNPKNDFIFGWSRSLVQFYGSALVSAKDWAKKWSHPLCPCRAVLHDILATLSSSLENVTIVNFSLCHIVIISICQSITFYYDVVKNWQWPVLFYTHTEQKILWKN